MSESDSGSSFVAGFIIGAAIGAAIGFLYAPKPGMETREMLKSRIEQAREKAEEAAEKAKEAAAEARKRTEAKLGGKKAAA